MKRYLFLICVSAFLGGAASADIAVENCSETLTFDTTPERIVVHDMNMTDMAFALELQDKIIGLTGITGWHKTSPEFDHLRGDKPELALKYPTIENLISAGPDMFFAGWCYGMRPGGDVTPDASLMPVFHSCNQSTEEIKLCVFDLLANSRLSAFRLPNLNSVALSGHELNGA